MKVDDFYKFVQEEMLVPALDIMRTKGQAYSGEDDKLGNFKRIANDVKCPVDIIWYTYFTKHIDALKSYIRREYKDSEPIKGRLLDIINYALLYAAILEERGEL